MNPVHLILFLGLASLSLYGGVVVLDSVSSDYIGSLSYSTTVASNDTVINTSGANQYFYLDHISTEANPYILVTYEGGNASDLVYVNGNLIGNLTPPSPDSIPFDVGFIALDTNVSFQFIGAVGKTNITESNISYQEFDGCNYSYEECKNMNVVNELLGFAGIVLANLPIIGVVALIIGALIWGFRR